MKLAEAEQFHAAIRAALRARLPPRFTRADVDELHRVTMLEPPYKVIKDLDIADRTLVVIEWQVHQDRKRERESTAMERMADFAPIVAALLALANEEAAE